MFIGLKHILSLNKLEPVSQYNVKLFILSLLFNWCFFSSGSQCLYFSHEPSSLFHHSVLVDLSVSMMMH